MFEKLFWIPIENFNPIEDIPISYQWGENGNNNDFGQIQLKMKVIWKQTPCNQNHTSYS